MHHHSQGSVDVGCRVQLLDTHLLRMLRLKRQHALAAYRPYNQTWVRIEDKADRLQLGQNHVQACSECPGRVVVMDETEATCMHSLDG